MRLSTSLPSRVHEWKAPVLDNAERQRKFRENRGRTDIAAGAALPAATEEA